MPKRLRVGICGAGAIARSHHLPTLTQLSEKFEVAALCDPDVARAKDLATEFSVPNSFESCAAMLRGAEMDVVAVCSPNGFHYENAVAALTDGKHVLCEKPLAVGAKHAFALAELAKRRSLALSVGLHLRYLPQAQWLGRFTMNGGLGQPYYARAQVLRRRAVPAHGAFLSKRIQGGGPLIDVGVHILDLTLWSMGYPTPVTVSACTWNRLGGKPGLSNVFGDYDRSQYAVEDLAALLIRFEGELAVSLEASFVAHCLGQPFQTEILGDKAGVMMSVRPPDLLRVTTEGPEGVLEYVPEDLPNLRPPNEEHWARFYEAIIAGSEAPIPAGQAALLSAIVEAAYFSAESGREEPVLLG